MLLLSGESKRRSRAYAKVVALTRMARVEAGCTTADAARRWAVDNGYITVSSYGVRVTERGSRAVEEFFARREGR